MTDIEQVPVPESTKPVAERTTEEVHGCPVSLSRGQRVVHVPRERYLEVMGALADDGHVLCAMLDAVDYLTHPGRPLPEGFVPERFEVVAVLWTLTDPNPLRVRVQVPADDATLPSLFELWPGTEAAEREVFDLFGITFTDHPDLTRILMPEDWVGHPLRKDYSVGAIPVQFKGAPESR